MHSKIIRYTNISFDFFFYIENTFCIDIDGKTIFKNRKFVKDKCSKIQIHFITTSLQINKIEIVIHETNKYVKVSVYFLNVKKNEQIFICITKKIFFVKKLKANLLIENDFLK